jgi:galactokinase
MGFGEACVALVAASKAEAIAKDVLERYKRSRCAARILVPEES